MQENRTMDIWNSILGFALNFPGARVNRNDFLTGEFSNYCSNEILNDILENGTIKAGIDLRLLDKIADNVISYHTGITTSLSAAAGFPGGFAMAATIPADLGQFYFHVIVVCQKLAYIYGWSELDNETNDQFKAVMTLFIGIMSGVNAANLGIKSISKVYLTKGVTRLATMKGLGNTVIYKIAADVAKKLGVKMSKKIFMQGVAKVVPFASAAICGGITLATFMPMAKNLKNKLRSDSEFIKMYF